MFKTIFTKLCNERGESPTAVCLKIGLSNSAYTAWRDDSIPRLSTLLKIAEYFNVSTDYLLGREVPGSPFSDPSQTGGTVLRGDFAPLTEREIRLMLAYRERTDVRMAVDKLLDLPDGDEGAVVYRAAQSEDGRPDEVVLVGEEQSEALRQVCESEDDLL